MAVFYSHYVSPVNIVSYKRDVWHYLAVVQALFDSPFYAKNPHVISDSPSRFFTPWTILVSMVGKGLALNAQKTLGIIGTLNAIVLVIGIWLFAREYWKNDWAPLILIVVMFAVWSTHVNHTGFHTLTTAMFSISYAFATVLGFGFIYFWVVLRALQQPVASGAWAVAVAVFTAFLFIAHQMQGAFAIGTAVTFAIFIPGASIGQRAKIIGSIVAGFALSTFWWYFDPIALVFVTNVYTDPPGVQYFSYAEARFLTVLQFAAPAFLGIIGFYDFAARRWRQELICGTTAIFLGIVTALALDIWIFGRFVPFFMLFLHFGWVGLILAIFSFLARDMATNAARIGRLLAATVFFGLLILLSGQALYLAWHEYRVAKHYLTGIILPFMRPGVATSSPRCRKFAPS